MRRRIVLPLAFAAAAATVFLAPAPPAHSQAKSGGDDRTIDTADGVKLSCRLYKAQADKRNSCVILMHRYQVDPNKGGWDDLAKTLAKNGYNVLRFDFRGHGGSKEVQDKFWTDPFNVTHVTGGTKRKKDDRLEFSKFKAGYFPQLVNDLAAARTLLDMENDNGTVNVSTTYLIGEQEMATLGMLFLASEWHRAAKEPPPAFNGIKVAQVFAGRRPNQSEPAGRDYGGCVWLSPARSTTIPDYALKGFISRFGLDGTGTMRDETPMLFVYGDKDTKGTTDAKFYFNDVMAARPRQGSSVKEAKDTHLRAIKNTSARGVDLLGKDDQLGTETMIVQFLDDMGKIRGNKNSFKRDYTRPLQIVWASFGIGQ